MPFCIAIAVGFGIAYLVASHRGLTGWQLTAENLRCFSDGFFTATVLVGGVGLLVLISGTTDFFDIFSYGFRSLLVLFTPFKNPGDIKRYREYKEERKQKRKGGGNHLLIAGLIFLALSGGCLWGYYQLL